MTEKNTDDDNNCCHDNFDQNFGNFDDNDDKKYWKNLQILLILSKILPFKGLLIGQKSVKKIRARVNPPHSGNARIEVCFSFWCLPLVCSLTKQGGEGGGFTLARIFLTSFLTN